MYYNLTSAAHCRVAQVCAYLALSCCAIPFFYGCICPRLLLGQPTGKGLGMLLRFAWLKNRCFSSSRLGNMKLST